MHYQRQCGLPRLLLVTTLCFFPHSGHILVEANALTDFNGLRDTINNASNIIRDPSNPGRGWGILPVKGAFGTADLVQNITSSVLKVKYNLDIDKAAWLNIANGINGTSPGVPPTLSPPNPPQSPPPIPGNPPGSPPSVPGTPGITPGQPPNSPPDSPLDPPLPPPPGVPINFTASGVDVPYIEYISTIPTLANALIDLGRAWHREMNTPVRESIEGLQLTMTAFSTSLLEAELIHSNATLRTIRASTSLENAKIAWSRLLNFPGNTPPGQGNNTGPGAPSPGARDWLGMGRAGGISRVKRFVDVEVEEDENIRIEGESQSVMAKRTRVRPFVSSLRFTHKDLWGRGEEQGERKRAATV